MLSKIVLDRLQARLQAERLPLSIRLWDNQTLVGTLPASVTLALNTPRAVSLFIQPSLSRLAEAYVQQWVDLEGDARTALTLLSPLFTNPKRIRKRMSDRWRFWRHNRMRDARAVSSHYDVSNEFYALWLDQRRVYSCAYFHTDQDSLDLAQEQKLDHVCRKLRLQPGERLLDIGCGWGALILWAAENYGADCTGITLSRNQYEHVQALIEQRGLADRCRVHLMDYRDVSEEMPFDKISSVGMFEHVGLRKLPDYFRKMHALLKPGGLSLNHGITSATFDDEYIDGCGHEFIERYVFPDGETTHVSLVIEKMARQGLECLDAENLRPHYARTLWQWVERLDARADEARALVGERKYRIWRAYMAGCAFAFESGWNAIYQILLAKPLDDGSVPHPLTRDYMYRADSPPADGRLS